MKDKCPSYFIVLMLPGAGEAGIGNTTGKPLQFKGSSFHRIIKGFMAQVCMHFTRVILFQPSNLFFWPLIYIVRDLEFVLSFCKHLMENEIFIH